MGKRVILFGEASRGALQIPLMPRTLTELEALLGSPPLDTLGLHLAVQTLLFGHQLIYVRVAEEGYSLPDYWQGAQRLRKAALTQRFGAFGLPGCGDQAVLDALAPVLDPERALLLFNERDFYDFLMQ